MTKLTIKTSLITSFAVAALFLSVGSGNAFADSAKCIKTAIPYTCSVARVTVNVGANARSVGVRASAKKGFSKAYTSNPASGSWTAIVPLWVLKGTDVNFQVRWIDSRGTYHVQTSRLDVS